MSWLSILSLILLPLTILDRAFHARRFWWAPLFGLAIQVPWLVYSIGLGWDGIGMTVMALAIAGLYIWNLPRWLKSRRV